MVHLIQQVAVAWKMSEQHIADIVKLFPTFFSCFAPIKLDPMRHQIHQARSMGAGLALAAGR